MILHLYQEHGMQAIEMLNGDFAFSLYDSDTGHLHLVCDRFGVMPLYYSEYNNSLYFSSEIKSILAIPGFKRALDNKTLQNHLQIFYFADETIFENVKQLAPGHYLTYNFGSGKLEISAYWKPPFGQNRRSDSADDLIDEFSQRFRESVKIRIPDEVKVGAYLGTFNSTINTWISAH